MSKYGNRVKTFFTLDGQYDKICTGCVGSHRYRVTVKTEGGHSFNAFGNKNALNILAKGIRCIYAIDVPAVGKTTYNVGTVTGGTSVNTIAQDAEMLCEYRSDSYENLNFMKNKFEEVFDEMREEGATVDVEIVGERPCMKGIDERRQEELGKMCRDIQSRHTNLDVLFDIGSTDCNIPLSMGINAICVGTYKGGGAHTREEWLDKASIPIGVDIIKELVEKFI